MTQWNANDFGSVHKILVFVNSRKQVDNGMLEKARLQGRKI
jgi:hypothetical protein